MVRIILDISSIDYDTFVSDILKQAKEHPEMLQGKKLPPFSDRLVKMMPVHQKNELVVNMINGHKAEMIPKISIKIKTCFRAPTWAVTPPIVLLHR